MNTPNDFACCASELDFSRIYTPYKLQLLLLHFFITAPRSKRKLRRRDKNRRNDPISSTEMVYVRKSPNYCKRDIARGVFGTKGRECKKNSHKSDGCNLLCCGRGYNTQVRYPCNVHIVSRTPTWNVLQ